MLTLRTLLTSMVILLYCYSSHALAHASESTTLDSVQYFQVPPSQKLSLSDVLARFHSGDSITSKRSFLSLGISNDITWVLLTITNHSQRSKNRRLTVGKTWIDTIRAYLLKGNTPIRSWQTGDHYPADNQLVAGLGYTLDLILPSGKSNILISAASFDPMTLPIQLQSPIEARNNDTFIHFSSALMYGILGALIIFNLILHLTLRQPYPLFYCVYIACFIWVNIAYNGYGFAWIYPHSTAIQSYATLVLMVLHSIAGITFVLSYLSVNKHRPIIYRLLIGYALFGAMMISYYISQLEHINATHFAFSYLSLSTVLMIITAMLSLKKVSDTKYFLLSIMCSMAGLLTTTFTVWGFLPYNYYTYHGAVWGVLCEAIFLTVIITIRLKNIESERIKDRHLSLYDPLTDLFNRRGFTQYGNELIEEAFDTYTPLTCVMMALDHFKIINNTYGHAVGDAALIHTASILNAHLREGDLVSRWGGEEIAILLPHTMLDDAAVLIERNRRLLEETPLRTEKGMVTVTASFGVAILNPQDTLEHILSRADQELYMAKQRGRNQVSITSQVWNPYHLPT